MGKEKREHVNVCVVGLGTVGMATAKYIISKGFNVYGYDVVRKETDFPSSNRWLDIPHSNIDIYVVCVWVDEELVNLYDVCDKIAGVNVDSLVAVESTVPVGTCRKIGEKYGFKLVYVPHRYWEEDPERYGVCQVRVFGYLDSESFSDGVTFYSKTLNIPIHVVDPIEVAELCKIAENTYRYLLLSFVEDLAIICDKTKIDFYELRNAMCTKWNVNDIKNMEPREGIGGKCLPKDLKLLMSLRNSPLLTGAIKVDKIYRKWRKEKGE